MFSIYLSIYLSIYSYEKAIKNWEWSTCLSWMNLDFHAYNSISYPYKLSNSDKSYSEKFRHLTHAHWEMQCHHEESGIPADSHGIGVLD